MVFFCLKLIILLFSLLGYMLHVHKRGIALPFSPIIATACVSLAMFFAGLFNIMPIAVVVLLVGGLVLFYRTVRSREIPTDKESLYMGLFFLLSYFFFAFRLRSTQVYWYDNFSHWALVVRDMLKTNHLPNFTSYLVDFQNYPTAGSGFCYYICKILDSSEGSMLFGQFLILLSCLCTFFGFIKANALRPLSISVFLMAAFYLLGVCVPVTELCVDTLISMLAIASFAAILYYRDDRPKAWICTAILTTFLTLVKTSGILFVLTHGLLLIIMEFLAAKKEKTTLSIRRLAHLVITAIGIPLFCYYLWTRHVDISFISSSMSKHSLSPAHLIGVFTSRSFDKTMLIISNFAKRLTYFEGEFTVLVSVPLVYLFCIGYKAFVQKKPVGYDLGIAGWCLFSYLVYLAGLLGTYLFAMPYDEAVELASFGRYLLTVTSYIVGITIIYLLQKLDPVCDKHHFVKATAIALVCFLVFATPISVKSIFVGKHAPADKQLLIRAKNEFEIPDESICYIVGEGNYSQLYYMARYELWSGNLTFGDGPEEDAYEEFIHSYEFLVVVEDSEIADRFLAAYGLPKEQRVYNLYDLR